jgi:hypothetical protein
VSTQARSERCSHDSWSSLSSLEPGSSTACAAHFCRVTSLLCCAHLTSHTESASLGTVPHCSLALLASHAPRACTRAHPCAPCSHRQPPRRGHPPVARNGSALIGAPRGRAEPVKCSAQEARPLGEHPAMSGPQRRPPDARSCSYVRREGEPASCEGANKSNKPTSGSVSTKAALTSAWCFWQRGRGSSSH